MKRVLVVEDVAPVRELVCEVLSRRGYEVYPAEDAEEAMEIGGRLSGLDLLLTDIELPGAKGTELRDWFSNRQPEIRVLYMSGYSDEMLDGAVGERVPFLPKPFTTRALLEAVEFALEAVAK